MLNFEICITDHNEILHTSRECNCRDVGKNSLWSVENILTKNIPNFDRISNSLKIPLVVCQSLFSYSWFRVMFLAATKQLYKWYFPSVCPSVCLSVCPSVRPSVTPFWLCSPHRIIMKFSGVITNDQSKVHAKRVKVRGQRSRSQRSQPNLTVSGL